MKLLVIAAVTAALVPIVATAEGGDQDQLGFKLGSFMAKPAITVSEGYDSNIFLDENGEKDSFITVIAPRMVIESDWNRHGIRLNTGLDYGYLESSTNDNYLDAFANLNGVLDATRDLKFLASVGYARDHDARGSDDNPIAGNAKHPVEFDVFTGTLGADATFGRFRVSPFGKIAYRDYQDVDASGGGKIDEDDRDRVRTDLGFEIGYSVRRGWEAFVRSTYIMTDYDDKFVSCAVPPCDPNRDSDGYRILGGVKVDVTRLVTASVGVGYRDTNYDDSSLSDSSGVATDIGVEWSITPRTTLFGAASIDMSDTTVNGASGAVDSEASIGVTHSLLRNLSISGSGTYINRSFDGISRSDDIYVGRIGAEWSVTRNFTLAPEYRLGVRNSNNAGSDYTDHQVRLSGTLRF